ncbi:replication-relaxation family protein [Bdellovibrio sp. SKB1291214]|uniref:replication-relaxation family protein n=1 Tax=Bdellovibrio sp. SKB1291214 TaxID=1732569 RepID=UPI00223F7507|nr:replication-relaxation family protein [Bdellovibrio sp. SKB1291214]UYL10273.1 replication-relaxation family protein [Bdellovibrio sp. SKB1291214]
MENLKKYGVLSTPQVIRLHFQSIAKTTALRRLRALDHGTFIRRSVPLDDGTSTWTLGLKGKRLLAVEESMQFSNRNTIYHDVLLNDVRMKFEDMGLARDWTPEYHLKSHAFKNYKYRHAKEQLIPDGMLIEPIRGKDVEIAIELELTRKSESRYKDIFREYRDINLDHVWYFVRSIKDKEIISRIAESCYLFDSKILLFSDVSDFLKDEVPQVYFADKQEPMPLSSIHFDRSRIYSPAHRGDQGVSRLEPQKFEIREVPMSLIS